MGYLFYDELLDKGFFNQDGWSMNPPGRYGLVNKGPFNNLTGGYYRTSTVYTPKAQDVWYFGYVGSDFVSEASGKYAWGFDLEAGDQLVNLQANTNSVALAVHAGDIHPLVSSPIPAAFGAWYCGRVAAIQEEMEGVDGRA